MLALVCVRWRVHLSRQPDGRWRLELAGRRKRLTPVVVNRRLFVPLLLNLLR